MLSWPQWSYFLNPGSTLPILVKALLPVLSQFNRVCRDLSPGTNKTDTEGFIYQILQDILRFSAAFLQSIPSKSITCPKCKDFEGYPLIELQLKLYLTEKYEVKTHTCSWWGTLTHYHSHWHANRHYSYISEGLIGCVCHLSVWCSGGSVICCYGNMVAYL